MRTGYGSLMTTLGAARHDTTTSARAHLPTAQSLSVGLRWAAMWLSAVVAVALLLVNALY